MNNLNRLSVREQRMAADVSKAMRDLYGNRLKCLIFFGSRAVGKARRDSDADFLIVLHDMNDPLLEIQRLSELISELSEKHGIIISAVPFLAESFDAPTAPSFIDTIRREGITLGV